MIPVTVILTKAVKHVCRLYKQYDFCCTVRFCW